MAKDNIYDKIVSELILRLDANTASNSMPILALTSSLGTNQVPVGFSSNVAFTSEVLNIPLGYTVTTNTHVITYPSVTPPTVGSTLILTGASIPVTIASLGGTYTVNTNVTLSNGVDPDINLTSTLVITAVSASYFGVVPFAVTPTLAGLTAFASTVSSFDIISTGVGRLLIALPVGSPAMLSLEQDNGLIYPVSIFTAITSGGYVYYQLNYDTQFTGPFLKTFTIHYS